MPLVCCLRLAQEGGNIARDVLDTGAHLKRVRVGDRLYLYYPAHPELDDGSMPANPRIRRLLREAGCKRCHAEHWPNNHAQDMWLVSTAGPVLTLAYMHQHHAHLTLQVDPVEEAE